MIEYTGSNPAANQNPWSGLFKTIAILRIGTGVLLMTRHAAAAVIAAYHFLWQEQEWAWVKTFADAGIPLPHLTAPAIALIVASVALSWIVGFLTRFFAFIFLPIIIWTLILLTRSGAEQAEAAWLYLLIAFTLLLFGSGAISIDKLFRLGEWLSRPKKRR